MIANEATSQTLIERVRKAFDSVAYPGDDDLTDSTYGEEPAALVDEFRGKTDWRSLDAAFLDQAPDGWSTALSFFSGSALHFYLPAYLIADLRGELQSQDPALSLCMLVTPQMAQRKIAKVWGGGTLGDHARANFDRFDAEQVSVIVDYLWFRLDRDGYDPTIEQGLEHYWLERASPTK